MKCVLGFCHLSSIKVTLALGIWLTSIFAQAALDQEGSWTRDKWEMLEIQAELTQGRAHSALAERLEVGADPLQALRMAFEDYSFAIDGPRRLGRMAHDFSPAEAALYQAYLWAVFESRFYPTLSSYFRSLLFRTGEWFSEDLKSEFRGLRLDLLETLVKQTYTVRPAYWDLIKSLSDNLGLREVGILYGLSLRSPQIVEVPLAALDDYQRLKQPPITFWNLFTMDKKLAKAIKAAENLYIPSAEEIEKFAMDRADKIFFNDLSYALSLVEGSSPDSTKRLVANWMVEKDANLWGLSPEERSRFEILLRKWVKSANPGPAGSCASSFER